MGYIYSIYRQHICWIGNNDANYGSRWWKIRNSLKITQKSDILLNFVCRIVKNVVVDECCGHEEQISNTFSRYLLTISPFFEVNKTVEIVHVVILLFNWVRWQDDVDFVDFCVKNSSFAILIRYSLKWANSFAIRHSLFAIRYSPFAIRHSLFAIR